MGVPVQRIQKVSEGSPNVVEAIEAGDPLRIEAVVLAETESQKRILIGAGGQMVKSVGTAARRAIEAEWALARPDDARPLELLAEVRDDPEAARGELLRVRAEFQRAFAAGLVCAAFERDPSRPRYLLFRES
jgi:hypothetical protein